MNRVGSRHPRSVRPAVLRRWRPGTCLSRHCGPAVTGGVIRSPSVTAPQGRSACSAKMIEDFRVGKARADWLTRGPSPAVIRPGNSVDLDARRSRQGQTEAIPVAYDVHVGRDGWLFL